MYLTYVEYQNMGGELDETTFLDCEMSARAIINHYTFDRLVNDTEFSENVKRLMFKLIKLVVLKDQALTLGQPVSGTSSFSGAIASQSNDGVSTTFNVLSASDLITASESEIRLLVKSYLGKETNLLGRRLLYRGIYPDE